MARSAARKCSGARPVKSIVSCHLDHTARHKLYLGLFCAGICPFFFNGLVNAAIADVRWLYWTFEVICWVVLPSVVFWVAIHRGELTLSQIGIDTRIRGTRNLPLLLALCVIAGPLDLALYEGLFDFFSRLLPGQPLFAYESVVPASGPSRLFVSVFFAISAAVV